MRKRPKCDFFSAGQVEKHHLQIQFASAGTLRTVSVLMRIAANTVAAFDYTLSNAQGEELDTSRGAEPLEYLHGAGNIIPGLERELEGLRTGEEKSVVVQPADGYGLRDARLLVSVPRERFETDDTIEVGMRFHAETPEGVRVMTVTAVTPENVTLDGNHPLAGEVLHFSVRIAAVREASSHEISHGHPHREGGCCGGGGCGGHGHHHHHHDEDDHECDGTGHCHHER